MPDERRVPLSEKDPKTGQDIMLLPAVGRQRFLVNVPNTSRTSIGFHSIRDWTALSRAGGD